MFRTGATPKGIGDKLILEFAMPSNKKHSRESSPRKESPKVETAKVETAKVETSKKQPELGPFGKRLLENLKNGPPGTSDETAIMQTFRSVPVDQLREVMGKGTPKEHAMLFSALPGRQIATVLGSLPASVLAPAEPPPAPPSPAGGPPASILQTTYQNDPYPPAQNDPNWTATFSQGNTVGITSPPPWEWVSVYDPTLEKEGSLNNPMAGVTGWVVAGNPPLSTADVWFVHPFGFDFQYYVVPDPQYESLLGPSNTGITPGTGNVDVEYNEATTVARTGIAGRKGLGLAAAKGVIGVETDQGLLPPSFQDLITDGTRIATFGRWIVDCGHNDFHTEIHAPLLIAVAKPAPSLPGVRGASQMTSVQILSRPYTVSQKFAEGNFVDHLLAEVGKVEASILGIRLSTRVEAHPNIFTTPYDGRPFIKLLVQPPVPKRGGMITPPQELMVSFHFTHRAGVAVRVYNAGNDTVGIIIVLGDLNAAKLPAKHDLTVQWSQLGDKYSYVIDALEITDLLAADTPAAFFLNRGILTDIYDPPNASSPLDNQNVAAPTPIDQVPAWAGLSEDDTQPFPIYGWLKVWWQDPQIVATGGFSPGTSS